MQILPYMRTSPSHSKDFQVLRSFPCSDNLLICVYFCFLKQSWIFRQFQTKLRDWADSKSCKGQVNGLPCSQHHQFPSLSFPTPPFSPSPVFYFIFPDRAPRTAPYRGEYITLFPKKNLGKVSYFSEIREKFPDYWIRTPFVTKGFFFW